MNWWWRNVKEDIRQYPRLQRKKNELLDMPVTARSGPGGTGGGGESRKTEIYALRRLPPEEERILDAVGKALELTKTMPEGEARLRLITLYYFRGLHLTDAALHIPVAERTAKRYNGAFVRLVARNLGHLIDDNSETERRQA